MAAAVVVVAVAVAVAEVVMVVAAAAAPVLDADPLDKVERKIVWVDEPSMITSPGAEVTVTAYLSETQQGQSRLFGYNDG